MKIINFDEKMSATKGNEFWKARSKHGRDKIFSSPEILWSASCEYFEWVKKNPLYETVVQAGKLWELPKMRAMTIEGLCIFLDIESRTFRQYSDENNESYKDYFPIITRISEIIRTQKFEGASAGFLNANIIARDLGLKENSDLTTNGKEINNYPPIFIFKNLNETK